LVLLARSHLGLVGGPAGGLIGVEAGLGGEKTAKPGIRLDEVVGEVGGGGVAEAPILLFVRSSSPRR